MVGDGGVGEGDLVLVDALELFAVAGNSSAMA